MRHTKEKHWAGQGEGGAGGEGENGKPRVARMRKARVMTAADEGGGGTCSVYRPAWGERKFGGQSFCASILKASVSMAAEEGVGGM
ncbi:hypothetical protein DUNSADRAFT_16240 [Dunaliella salina]|uniref:Encoded protein n=1 Tax=Dunaliella salina TaxID=3046 RepID=A0ABQ7H147_DUNSA|nr:hypothetical protein DUNSADRAFT_16240 [Dunaliella salina]|eukprot:KAF5840577.1 hypothetical protein DUNSADRAFT_16240 [Dunaliella salina]